LTLFGKGKSGGVHLLVPARRAKEQRQSLPEENRVGSPGWE
jgi:hypothetical protein